MKNYILTLTVAIFSTFCNGQSLNTKSISDKTDTLVAQYQELGIFSGVVLIAENGKPFYHKAFGLADREKNIPNTLQTAFVIGSMNKTFTRTIILQLIDEKKVKFSDNMVSYLSGFHQPDAGKITIKQLLDHTSGFGDYHSPEFFDLPNDQKNIQGILAIIKNMELLFEPGTENEYSNAGYILLGAIIEKVTGKSYAENVNERIKKPLQLHSLVTQHIKNTPNRAIGYMKTIDGFEDNENVVFEPKSDGGCYATAADMMKFYRAYLYGNSLFSEKVKKEDGFFQRIKPIYQEKGAGIPLAGGFNGANTVHLEMLADNISIVVFANMDEPVAENIAFGIHKIVNGKEPSKPQLPTILNVYKAYKENGIAYVKEHFETLTDNWFENDPKDLVLNNLGYNLLFKGQVDDALQIFKLNTELFPKIGNCWDSYGEVLLKKGQKEEALEAYKKALEINPNIPSAKKMVKELEN
ncbi:MAG TPA: beta-lactamase family protein [Saprospiraceae bacterium]|nr:beta-lactamase family protein [Saprospiraceae bacterium]HMQ82866.1 beta-lactamase family protein [Saprospiraceae bacterium]